MPDIIHIFLNSSVRCKLTCTCCVHHGHTSPAFFIFVCFFHFLLRCCIGTEVSKDKVLVCSFSTVLVEKRIIQITEQFCIRREGSVNKLCQYLTDFIICIVDTSRIRMVEREQTSTLSLLISVLMQQHRRKWKKPTKMKKAGLVWLC